MTEAHALSPKVLLYHTNKLISNAEQSFNQRRMSAIVSNVAKSSASPVNAIPYDANGALPDENLAVAAADALDAIGSTFTGPVIMRAPDPKPAPMGPAWSRLSQNLTVSKGNEELFFVPWLGDSDDHQIEAAELANELADLDAPDTSPDEETPEQILQEKILTCVMAAPILKGLDQKILEQGDDSDAEETSRAEYVVNVDEGDDGDEYEDDEDEEEDDQTRLWSVPDNAWDRAWKRVAIRDVVKSVPLKAWPKVRSIIAEVLGISRDAVNRYLSNAMYRENMWLASDLERCQREIHRIQVVKQIREAPRPSTELILDSNSVGYFLCRQCFTYDCLRHANATAKPTKIPSDPTRKTPGDEADACIDFPTGGCFFRNQFNKNRPESKVFHFPDVGKLAIELRNVYGDDFCRLTKAMYEILPGQLHGVTCADVGRYVMDERDPGSLKPMGKEPDRRRKHSKLSMKEKFSDGKRWDFEACNHDGACTKANECKCAIKGIPCEKFCGCNHARVCGERAHAAADAFCPRAAKGCSCKSVDACRTKACDCFGNLRECDPDLCGCMQCSDGPPGTIGTRKTRKCRNASILLGEHHRVVVGRSRVHGWGTYSTGHIPKGDLIGEYIGEAIFHDQAEQRGRVYDKRDHSFMFEVSNEVTLDATRMGNKLRFCNHHEKPNMECKLMRVVGDIRVGMYAVVDILPFEELFFDYGTQFTSKWKGEAKKKSGGKAAKKSEMDFAGEADRLR